MQENEAVQENLLFPHNTEAQRRLSKKGLLPNRGSVLSMSANSLAVSKTCISKPRRSHVLKWIAAALFSHLKQGMESSKKLFVDIFDEKVHPLDTVYKKRLDGLKDKELCLEDFPSIETEIFEMLMKIFTKERLPSEVGILALAYIERILGTTKLTIHISNWRRILLSTIILASKVWEEQAVWNIDFIDLYSFASVKDLNKLERRVLELIDFNVSVTGKLYAKYYFELRALASQFSEVFPLDPLDEVSALRIEKNSLKQERLAKKLKSVFCRSAPSVPHFDSSSSSSASSPNVPNSTQQTECS